MDFELTADQRLLRDAVRRFVADRVAPAAVAWDRAEQIPTEVVQEMAEMGLLGVVVAPEYGGAGLAAVELALVVEELAARGDGSLALTVASHNALCATHIQRFGTRAQKERYLPVLARGEALGAWALGEPGGGQYRWPAVSDGRASQEAGPVALGTKAVRDGNRWRISGQKERVTHGGVGGVFVVLAQTDGDGRGEGNGEGIAAFIVDKGAAGLVPRPTRDKLGMRASDTADLYFDNLQVSEESRLGQRGGGLADALQVIAYGRIAAAALAVGIGRAALEHARAYALERRQFGKPIAEFQAIQLMLADMATELDAARLLAHRAGWHADAGRVCGKEAAMAKLFASEAAMRATDAALQILGGVGYTVDFPVERHYRDAKVCCIDHGTSEAQRLVIARHILHAAGP